MENIRDSLLLSLETGFINHLIHSNQDYLPQLLVNDKLTGRKVLTTIEHELQNCDEFWFSVAFLTTSGLASIKNILKELQEKDVKGKILVSQYLNFTHPQALTSLLKFPNIKLKIAVDGDFHSKGYLFQRGKHYNLIIGSSNLTAAALSTNIEWNLKISATPDSTIISNSIKEFTDEFKKAKTVNENFIQEYEKIFEKQVLYNSEVKEKLEDYLGKQFEPNLMQSEALKNISKLRAEKKKKALLISATGTGKTYLSAFVGKLLKPNKFLFVVHRENIALAALKTYKNVFGRTKSMGLYTGNKRDIESDFIFSTVQTISKREHLEQFNKYHFDYLVIDESHRAGATSYENVLNYFKPKFLLGMTATPERTDGYDIFQLFDHNIAYEIRLNRAMEEDMLCPFHYYGVTDIEVNGNVLDDKKQFAQLTSSERIKHIIEKAEFYGCDDGIVRGLIFCSNIKECEVLSEKFNELGKKTIALTGSSTENDRIKAINLLESDNMGEKIDYIFTVDIFNEGIDIPRVNQIIMLRPTQSAIIFVQQLGRGLRKADRKDYLTVIDFIGNYSNNYLVPIALYGDTSYNKDSLRKLIASGSSLIPGSSTINFDKISRDRIYDSINSANMSLKKDLQSDYNLLKFKLGRIPMMVDFLDHGSRDPQLYVNYSKSYFNFVEGIEDSVKGKLDKNEIKLLELFSSEINNAKRIDETVLLSSIIKHQKIKIENFVKTIKDEFGFEISDSTINSCINNLNFNFIKENKDGKLQKIGKFYKFQILKRIEGEIIIEPNFENYLKNSVFKNYLFDSIDYSLKEFNRLFERKKFIDGFVLYRKYSRKDVFRILNWDQNPNAQTVGGYMFSTDKTNCPIFVNYHKEENISESTKYEDKFINNSEFEWMSKSNRNLESPEIQNFKNFDKNLRIPLFIKKNNDEGMEFYFMGDITPIKKSIELTSMQNDKKKNVSVVKMRFSMNTPVEDSMYYYITKI